MSVSDLPLQDVRILAVEQYGAGPYATQHLAALGAEVIKIEPPVGGDSARQAGPHFLGPNESQFFQAFNLGKKSLALDIRKDEGKAIFRRLVATADGVLNNLRGDQPAKLGLDYQNLGGAKPSIVCAHLSGYGRTGSRAAWPAYDYLMQAEAGFMSVTGEPDQPPTRMGLSIVDYLTGITTAFALTTALYGALRTGRGRDIDVTLYDVAIHQLTYPAVFVMNANDPIVRRPRSGHPTVVPCETFSTADGKLFVMAMLPRFWEELCAVLGEPELSQDVRFSKPAARLANRDALIAIFDPIFQTQTTAAWMARLAGRVPAAPVLTLTEALANPFLAEREMVQSLEHPLRPDWKALTSPVRPDDRPAIARPAPMLGQHTDEILDRIGIDAGARSALRVNGVIG